MIERMPIEVYLARGGRLTSPDNAPPRYRAELMKIMATFVDSELAGAAGFADIINTGPGIKERISAARIVMEKFDHAERVLGLMGEFGANTSRYATNHPWTQRLSRDSDISATRGDHDMRLAVFNYPLEGWADAVMMNLLMGLAVEVQIEDMVTVSYQPLGEILRGIAPREARHCSLAREGLERLIAQGTDTDMLTASAHYWWPRVAISFGASAPERLAALQAFGLRRRGGEDMRVAWEGLASRALANLGISRPG